MNELSKAIIRLIVMAVLGVNAILTATGHNPIPFDGSAVTEVLTQIAAGLSCLWVWWKDNNVTKKAQEQKAIAKSAMSGEISVIAADDATDADDAVVEELETEYEE